MAPLLKEINEILSHETNALLASTNGLLGKTLESIFDPKTLARKHEKIDKALAQALSKNKVGMPKAAPKPALPAPRMAPKAAEDAPKVVQETRVEGSAGSVKIEAAPEQVDSILKVEAAAEQGATVIKMEAAPEQTETKVTVEKAPAEPESGAKPQPEKPAEIKLEKPKEQPKEQAKEQPKPRPKEGEAAAVADNAPRGPSLLVRILSYPMRFVPENAKLVVSAFALTMLFAMPVAWALAMRSANYDGIGPIDFTQITDAEAAEAASKRHADKAKGEDAGESAGESKPAKDSKDSGAKPAADAKKS